MIRINLLGQPRPKKARVGGAPMAGTLQLILLLVAVVLGLGALYIHHRQMSVQLAQLKVQITKQTAESTRLQNIRRDMDQRTQERAVLQQRRDALDNVNKNRSALDLLDALANTVTRVDALWMNGLKRTGESLQLDGQADNLNAVASFITELKRSGYFDKVEVKETKQDDKNPGVTTFVFTLTADFTMPSQGPAQQPPAKTSKN